MNPRRSAVKRKLTSALRPRYNVPGSRPGTVKASEETTVKLSVFDFNAEGFREERDASLDTCRKYFTSKNVTWVHVQGEPNRAVIDAVGQAYRLHALALEDVVNRGQRAKLEYFEQELFAVLHLPRIVKEEIQLVQVSLFLGPSYLVSFCEISEDPFELVRARVRAEPPGRIRQHGPDFLFYALIDLVIDQGFPVLDHLSEEIESLEEIILANPEPQSLDRVHHLKRNLIVLRKSLWPQREVVSSLTREEHPLIKKRTGPYLRDCYDHTIRILDLIESYREMTSGLHDLYLTSISNRMNDIMKMLTIIATIFIPLSFLAGLYGMNFNTEISPWNMPELNWRYGYPVFLGLMLAIGIGMLIYFRRRRWL